jgi:hypothetical protein
MDSAGGSPSRATLAARAFGVHTRLPRACAARRITDRWHAGSTARRIPYSEIRFTRRATDSDVSSRKGRKSVVHQLVARKRSFCGERLAGGLLVEERSRCGESGPSTRGPGFGRRKAALRSATVRVGPTPLDRRPRATLGLQEAPTSAPRAIASRAVSLLRGGGSPRGATVRVSSCARRAAVRVPTARRLVRVSLAFSWNACRFGTERRPCVRQRRVREPLSEHGR